jgi:endo-1,4-beta-D-glucanase Y
MRSNRQRHASPFRTTPVERAAIVAKPEGSVAPRTRNWLALPLALACSVGALLGSGCRAEQQWPLWEQYTQHFIDDQGRVIDHNSQERTTSEGQGYALFFSLVDNDRPRFDKLLHWTEANLAAGDLTERLPGWNWGKAPDGNWRILDPNPAADADLWIAYSLLEAGRLWHDERYERIGTAMATRISHEEVALIPGLGTTLIAGAHGFHPDPASWIVNPSYLPPPLLVRMAQLDPAGPWASILASLKPLLARGSGAGYAMDWVAAGTTIAPSETPAQLAAGVKDQPAIGSYDAIRVYLWLGISDASTPGLQDLLGDVSGMATYLQSQPIPPERVDGAGKVLGPNGPAGFSAAVFPYLIAKGMSAQAKAQLDRAMGTRNPATGLIGHGEYYDQNLALFATGWSEERYRFDREGRLKVRWK